MADDSVPEDLHVTISWLLETTTFVAIVLMENMPTLTETASDPYMARTSTSTPLHTAKMVVRDWIPTVDIDHISRSPSRHSPPQYHGETKKPSVASEGQWHKKEHLYLTPSELPQCSTTFFTP